MKPVLYLGAILAAVVVATGAAGSPGTITEYTLHTPNALPRELTRGSDGALWFTMESGFAGETGVLNNGGIGRIALDGTTTEYALPTAQKQRGGPKAIASGPDGALWYTGVVVPNAGVNWPVIGRVTTAGAFSYVLLPDSAGRPDSIVAGPDGALWFTDNGGYYDAALGKSFNAIGRLTTTGSFTFFRVPTPSAGVRGLTVGPDGNIWFVEQSAGKIGRLAIDTGQIDELPIPNPSSQPIQIATGADGNLWFGAGYDIDRMTPAGVVTVFPMGVGSGVQGLVAGPDGNVWAAASSGRLVKVTPAGAVTSYAIPSTNGVLPIDVAVGDDGSLWFTERSDDQIGRYELAPAAALSVADTSVAEGDLGTTIASFTVSLASPATSPVTVHYATADGTATAGLDYTAAAGDLTFAPGETSKTVDVLVLGDTADEPDETFGLDLSAPTGATIASGHATGTIVDDDVANRAPAAQLAIAPAQVPAGEPATFDASGSTDPDGDPLTYRFAVDGAPVATGPAAVATYTFASPGPHTVEVEVSDGTATASATAAVNVERRPVDLSASLTVTPSPVPAGTAATLVATIANAGPMAPKDGATLTVAGPGLGAGDVVSPGGATCVQAAPGTVDCSFPAALLGPGASRAVVIGIEPQAAADYVASTRAGDADTDTNPANDSTSLHVAVAGEYVDTTVAAGGTATTDSEGDGATADDPVETAVTTPNGGRITIAERPAAPTTAGAWSVLGYEVAITAPTASTTAPLALTFRLDSSLFAGAFPLPVVFRDGVPAGLCLARAAASPDPCVSALRRDGDDVVVAVRSSHASRWTFGVPIVTRGKITGPGLEARSDGRAVRGELEWRGFHARLLLALRVDGNRAWLAGIGRDGRVFEAYAEDGGPRGSDVFRLAIAGVTVADGAPRGNVVVHGA